MNPLEAMARAIYENAFPGEKWEDATTADREIAFSIARAAIDAYEAAMKAAGYHWECARNANSKPLPQPPEVKHEPD